MPDSQEWVYPNVTHKTPSAVYGGPIACNRSRTEHSDNDGTVIVFLMTEHDSTKTFLQSKRNRLILSIAAICLVIAGITLWASNAIPNPGNLEVGPFFGNTTLVVTTAPNPTRVVLRTSVASEKVYYFHLTPGVYDYRLNPNPDLKVPNVMCLSSTGSFTITSSNKQFWLNNSCHFG